jgi:hypothetical protein
MPKRNLLLSLILVFAILMGIAVGAQLLRGSPKRWKEHDDFRQDIENRFPKGTHVDKVSDWLTAMPHCDWGDYYFDEKAGFGMIIARIFNGLGSPRLYGNYAVEVVLRFDKAGQLTGYSSVWLSSVTWRSAASL